MGEKTLAMHVREGDLVRLDIDGRIVWSWVVGFDFIDRKVVELIFNTGRERLFRPLAELDVLRCERIPAADLAASA